MISGNDGSGVRLSDVTRTVIQDNLIGTTADGTSPLGNATNGIILTSGASNNLIGGVNPGEANNIAFNGDDGVDVDHPGIGNAIRGNRIY